MYQVACIATFAAFLSLEILDCSPCNVVHYLRRITSRFETQSLPTAVTMGKRKNQAEEILLGKLRIEVQEMF